MVYRRIYSRKFSFTATSELSCKTWFPNIYPTIYLPKWNFEYDYPNSNALLQSQLKLEHCKPHKAAHRPTKCDIINDAKLFPTVYRRIYCCKNLTLSNQMSLYKSKCIRICIICIKHHFKISDRHKFLVQKIVMRISDFPDYFKIGRIPQKLEWLAPPVDVLLTWPTIP